MATAAAISLQATALGQLLTERISPATKSGEPEPGVDLVGRGREHGAAGRGVARDGGHEKVGDEAAEGGAHGRDVVEADHANHESDNQILGDALKSGDIVAAPGEWQLRPLLGRLLVGTRTSWQLKSASTNASETTKSKRSMDNTSSSQQLPCSNCYFCNHFSQHQAAQSPSSSRMYNWESASQAISITCSTLNTDL